MGRLKKGTFEFTEQNIIDRLRLQYKSNPEYVVANLFVFGWESDFLVKTRAGYWYEVEVKISVADFKNDRKNKPDKYHALGGLVWGQKRPNYFSYCVPDTMLDKVLDLIPDYAGIVTIDTHGWVQERRAPKKLHEQKIPDDDLGLLKKFYYNYTNLRWRKDHSDEIIKRLRKEIHFVKEEYKAATGYPISDIF